MKEDEKMKQPTKFMKAYTESHYDQVFHVATAVAALFGYPAPPVPRTLKSNPEWRAYLDERNVRRPIPDTAFYGNSPYVEDVVRTEAYLALNVLTRRHKRCMVSVNGVNFLSNANEKQLKAIYHTFRSYVLDENVSIIGGEFRQVGMQSYQRFDVSKDTDGSASEAIEFNKWLGLFFQTCSRAEASAVKGGWRWLLLENAEAPDITRG